MSTHRITAGHGYVYLTSQTMINDGAAFGPGGVASYYSENGEAPGRWMGRGLESVGLAGGDLVLEEQMIALFGEGRHPCSTSIRAKLRAEGLDEAEIAEATELGRLFVLNSTNSAYRQGMAQLAREWNVANGHHPDEPVPDWVRSRIRTAVGGALFAREHGREAGDARELSDFIAVISRRGSKAVAGFDLTFSPVKSVSALWALCDAPTARAIEGAHDAAVRDVITWLEENATFTRLGRGGVRQVEVHGLLAAAFVHRTSRAGNPDLHSHVAISNKVQTLDGRWRALDGRVLFKATVAASERYNTRLELELRERLGVSFIDVEHPGLRPVRGIAGMDPRLLRTWSTRRTAIDERRATLGRAFERDHGRAPTPIEATELAQQATLETRPKKPTADSETLQRARWRAEAIQLLGSTAAVEAMFHDLRTPAAAERPPVDIRGIAHAVIDRLARERASWQRWHVVAEAQRILRREQLPVAQLDSVLLAVVDAALIDESIALTRPDEIPVPAELRRSDGSSVYAVAGAQLYTSQTILDAERSIIDAAQRTDGVRVSASAVDIALLEAAANGLHLNDGQAEFVRALSTSGARCQLALAPAGTGKTTALRVVSSVWSDSGGRVLALAPSAAAARVLGEALDSPSDTLAKALLELDTGRMTLDPAMLVVVDEAGMAGTADLARLMRHVLAGGASLRLVGDDRQLAAIGAGGVLRDIAETAGAITLSDAMRFVDPDEAEASALIRRGEPSGLDFYLDHDRVSVGDDRTAVLSAFAAWQRDRAQGLDSVLLAATRDEAHRLNKLAQAAVHAASAAASSLPLADGTTARAGDVIVTRRNDRRLGITSSDWVKNGDRWTVDRVLDSGALRITHHDTGRHIALPAAYARTDVELGYATTIHGAQGSTADSCHVVVSAGMSREQLYVALTRGRQRNELHVVTASGVDEHAVLRREITMPPAARDVLEDVLANESAARSVTTELRELHDPSARLRSAAARFTDALTQAPRNASGAAAAALPWLAAWSRPTDPAWSRYLDRCSALTSALAERVGDDARLAVACARDGTALSRQDPDLAAAHAVFLAVHGRATTREDVTDTEHDYLQELRRRIERHNRDALRSIESEPTMKTHNLDALSVAHSLAPELDHPEDGLSL